MSSERRQSPAEGAVRVPTELSITASGNLSLRWPDEPAVVMRAELLRVMSPSAEVRGHDGMRRLVSGKSEVRVSELELVGHYGLKIGFDDGHDSGIYTWQLLGDLCTRRDSLYREYLEQLQQHAKASD